MPGARRNWSKIIPNPKASKSSNMLQHASAALLNYILNFWLLQLLRSWDRLHVVMLLCFACNTPACFSILTLFAAYPPLRPAGVDAKQADCCSLRIDIRYKPLQNIIHRYDRFWYIIIYVHIHIGLVSMLMFDILHANLRSGKASPFFSSAKSGWPLCTAIFFLRVCSCSMLFSIVYMIGRGVFFDTSPD